LSSPSNNITDLISGIGCQTTKSGDGILIGGLGTKKNFNLKIKLKNDQSSSAIKKLKENNSIKKNNPDYSSCGGVAVNN